MHARAAYIRSIGTTGILVAAALLMLATVSALVAYEGWPGSAGSDSVTSVPVETPRDFEVVRSVTKAEAAAATVKLALGDAVVRPAAAGLVRDVTAGGPSTVGLVKVPPAAPPAAPAPVGVPAPAPAVQPPSITQPQRPSPPSIAVPEVLPPPADGLEEVAFGVLGTALPPDDSDSERSDLQVDLGALGLQLR